MRITSLLAVLILVFSPFLTFGQSWKELHQKGKKAYQDGKYEEAHENFLNAQRQAPEHIDFSKDIATAAYRMGDYESSANIFSRKAEDITKSKTDRAKKWHNVGNSQMKKKNYASAVESYKNALRLDPSSQQTRYNYAEAKRRLKQQEEQENQNDQNDQNDQSDDNNDGEGDNSDQNRNDDNQNDGQNQDNESSGDESDGDNQEQQNQQDQQSKSQDSTPNKQHEEAKASKSQRQVDKKLEELLKREMEIQRRVEGYKKGEETKSKSKKKW